MMKMGNLFAKESLEAKQPVKRVKKILGICGDKCMIYLLGECINGKVYIASLTTMP